MHIDISYDYIYRHIQCIDGVLKPTCYLFVNCLLLLLLLNCYLKIRAGKELNLLILRKNSRCEDQVLEKGALAEWNEAPFVAQRLKGHGTCWESLQIP